MTNNCTICIGERPTEVGIDSCNHSFCNKCICKWAEKENTCPLCRKKFNIIYNMNNNIIIDIIKDKNQDEEDDVEITTFYDHLFGVTYTTTNFGNGCSQIDARMDWKFKKIILNSNRFQEKNILNYHRKLNTTRFKDMKHFQRIN